MTDHFGLQEHLAKFVEKKMHCCPFPDFTWLWPGWICSWARTCLQISQNEIAVLIVLVFLLLFIFLNYPPYSFLITFFLFSPTTIRNFFWESSTIASCYHSEMDAPVGTFDLHLTPGRKWSVWEAIKMTQMWVGILKAQQDEPEPKQHEITVHVRLLEL